MSLPDPGFRPPAGEHSHAPSGPTSWPAQQAPGYPQQAYAPQAAPTNTMAILSLVFAFVFGPLGLFFGIKARKQIRTTGEGGSGLALAGIIISSIGLAFTVLYVVLVAVLLAVGTTAP